MTKQRMFKLLKLLPIIIADLLLLRYANTVDWPYLWPQPGVLILLGLLVVVIWFPRYLTGIWALRVVGAVMLFVGQCYLIHSFMTLPAGPSWLGAIHLIGFTGTLVAVGLNYVNQINPRNNIIAPPLPAQLPAVAAVIPTYGEPVDILEQTVQSLQRLEYPADLLYIFISDDGHREDVRALAERYGIGYNYGARKDAKAGNLNSGLVHIAEHFPQATLILTQDADEIIDPSFLRKTVGYLTRDKQIAFVQTPKEAFTPPGDLFGNRDRIFYDVLQPGRNGNGVAFSCGSGVVWRISALESIGGFVTWNIVEDLTTSYLLHCAGYTSEYHNEILTIGLSPDDIPSLLKQRGTWATDTWRFFLFLNPLWYKAKLSIRQRLQYLELGLFYVSSTLFTPLLMITPLLSLLTGQFIKIEGSALFSWTFFVALYYLVLARGNITYLVRMWQYWIGHAPTYWRALWIAAGSRHKKPAYQVTRKTRQAGFYGSLIWPQFVFLLCGAVAVLNGIFGLRDVALDTRVANIAILIFFMFMTSGICRAAFFGVGSVILDRVPKLWQWFWQPLQQSLVRTEALAATALNWMLEPSYHLVQRERSKIGALPVASLPSPERAAAGDGS
jgi:cellulose synthase (UDP-forming)